MIMSSPRFSSRDTSATAHAHTKSLSSPVLRRPSAPYLLPPSPMPLSAKVFPIRPPKMRRRATFLALVALVICFLYLFFHSPFPASTAKKSGPSNVERVLETLKAHHQNLKPFPTEHRKQIHLDAAQELAAVSSFLASLPHNIIPSYVDSSVPIDPQLILDFDTRGPRAEQEVQAMVADVWTRNPVFLYSKVHSSASREIKSILASLNLYPSPRIIDVDTRSDADVLQPLLARLTGHRELPILIVGGELIGPISEIQAMEKTGELHNMIAASGAVIDGAKRKKHRNH